MSIKVQLNEGSRHFTLSVGGKTFGKITSHRNSFDEKDDEPVLAEVYDKEGSLVQLGWYPTLIKAAKAILSEKFYDDDAKVDEVLKTLA